MEIKFTRTSFRSLSRALFAAPCYAAGASIVAAILAWTAAGASRADDISVSDTGGVVELKVDGKTILEYRSQPNPTKVYVSRWFTPKGTQILRDSPHDHVHHHALMYAIGIDDVDFWSEGGPAKIGRQVPLGTSSSSATSNGKGQTTIGQRIQWMAPDDVPLALESRSITVHLGVTPACSLLTWQCSLEPAEGKSSVNLWGRHYFGWGVRFVTSMDKDGVFMFPGGGEERVVRGTEKLTRAPWCAFSAQADGQPVTVAMFDAPTNPRHPATWFTMTSPFAYMAATLNLEAEPLSITKDQPLKARYGIAAWDGIADAAAVDAAYKAWLALD